MQFSSAIGCLTLSLTLTPGDGRTTMPKILPPTKITTRIKNKKTKKGRFFTISISINCRFLSNVLYLVNTLSPSDHTLYK
uniref:Putative secreted protein n=1 Tax=Ixodes ricinus TaxID=34613 RepID=A0A147BND8_IXORI